MGDSLEEYILASKPAKVEESFVIHQENNHVRSNFQELEEAITAWIVGSLLYHGTILTSLKLKLPHEQLVESVELCPFSTEIIEGKPVMKL